jgi:hypothetical protein
MVLAAARQPELPRPNETWITLQADEFHFVSNASERDALDIARDLLRMRAAIRTVTKLKVRSSLATTVFIFANARGFVPQHLTEFLQNVQRQAAAERINQAIAYAKQAETPTR